MYICIYIYELSSAKPNKTNSVILTSEEVV